ncbi:MAG: hypothetical protein COS08_03450 [Euryarchaeota archaeon CG01_land_8_20_14_3_00_38_12]|nr:MAG: hypothetical protein COS08_03450 [Euryarchaeota archaeon CG01_land_8_20_14_3_00_38_12]
MVGLKARETSQALTKKGFVANSRSDHVWYTLIVNGKDVGVWTRISHGSGKNDIPIGIQHKMARQIGLKYKQFIEYVECTLDYSNYIRTLRENGTIPNS